MRSIFLLSLLVLGACASSAPVDPNIARVTAGTVREMSSFDTHEKYSGPQHAIDNAGSYALVRAWRKPNRGYGNYQLYVHVEHTGRQKDFINASLPGGKLLEIKNIDSGLMCTDPQEAINCPMFEDVGIWMDVDLLRKAAKNEGLSIRLNATRGGDVVVRVPAWYLKGYLHALKQ